MQLTAKGEVKGKNIGIPVAKSRFHFGGNGRHLTPGRKLGRISKVSCRTILEPRSPSVRVRAMATTTDGKKRVQTGITVLGLTGSIGMGKSTVANMFQKHGIPVLDADKIVHDLYGVGGAAVPLVEAAFPGTTVEGVIWRPKLSTYVIGNEAAMEQLEDIVHPLVEAERRRWLDQMAQEGNFPMAVLDIPLLYETGAENQVDAVVVVSAPADVQRERVMARPGMSAEKFEAISGRQLPDEEKRRRADYVIDTGGDIADTEKQVEELVAKLLSH